MPSTIALLWSSVGRKYLMSITGLIWIGFVTMHLLGNLTLFVGADTFNAYSHRLISLGPLLWVAEIGLVAFLLLHIVSAIAVTLDNWKARRTGYEELKSAGGASQKTLSSTTMIWSGLALLVFLVIHVIMFKYGPEYETTVHGVAMRDLYKLVVESFQSLPIVAGYVFCMVVLGLHLRHGFWSAFQSLGVNGAAFTPFIQAFALVYAIAFALGYIVIPVWIYFGGGQ